MLLPLWLLLKFVSLLESSLCQNARILDKRFPASIIILFKFKCRLPPCKCDAEMLLWRMTFLSSCFKMLYLLLYIVVFANLMELVLLYLWKMFTAQRILYVHRCSKQSSWDICLPEEKELFVFIVDYVWRCREMSRAHRIKYTRSVQTKGIKGFSSVYTRSFS